MQTGDLDEIAQQLLDELHLTTCDAFELAHLCGYDVLIKDDIARGFVTGGVIAVRQDRPERMQFTILHELSHVILDREGLPNTEVHANTLASALLLPRRSFKAELKRHNWDLRRLKQSFPNASYEAIGRRICSLRDATLWIRDVAPGIDRVWRAGKVRKLDEATREALLWVCETDVPWHSPNAVRVEEEGWVRGLVVA